MPSPIDIILHTPLWVWPLLALVLWLGWSARKPRVAHPLRLVALPLVGLGVTAAGIVQSAMPAFTLAGWLAGLLLTLPVGYTIGRRRGIEWQDDGRVRIAGSWFLLGFAIAIFVARYALGVTFGVWPRLALQPAWITGAGLVGGVIAGIGLGWLAGLLLRRRWLGRVLLGGAALPPAALAALAVMVAYDAPVAMPRLAAVDGLTGVERWDFAEIPEVRRVAARDGAPLTYRLYPGRGDRTVVLVHGSSAASISMHKSAQALQAAGATVYAISLRGHGGSGTVNGDTSYQRQLDDDLADFVKAVGIDGPKIHRTLAGFSLGGGFVLRTASGSNRGLFDAYLAVSPHIAQDSPTSRQASGGWVSVAVSRLIGLSLLQAVGLPWFQELPVIRYATNAEPSDTRTPVYSYRLLTGMVLSRDWRAEIGRIARPTAVVIGERDELFKADQFAPLFATLNPKIAVTVVPGLGHMDMITDLRGTDAVASAWQRLVDAGPAQRAERFDTKVREDMFAGFDGDETAFKRAMELVDRTLADDPNHAEALTWRGAGRLFLAGQAFGRRAFADGLRLQTDGLADLDRGVALGPDMPGTHGLRGPVLLIYAAGLRAHDRGLADRLTMTALSDYEFMIERERPRWARLDTHDRGEVLGGLAQGWLQLDEPAKATPYLERMIAELPNTPYAKAATQRRADPSSRALLTCLGCH